MTKFDTIRPGEGNAFPFEIATITSFDEFGSRFFKFMSELNSEASETEGEATVLESGDHVGVILDMRAHSIDRRRDARAMAFFEIGASGDVEFFDFTSGTDFERAAFEFNQLFERLPRTGTFRRVAFPFGNIKRRGTNQL